MTDFGEGFQRSYRVGWVGGRFLQNGSKKLHRGFGSLRGSGEFRLEDDEQHFHIITQKLFLSSQHSRCPMVQLWPRGPLRL